MNFKLTGVIEEIKAVQEVSATFSKRELILHVPNERGESKWDDHFKIEFHKNSMSKLDDWSKGTTVEVSCSLRGKPWEKNGVVNHFTSIVGFDIAKVADIPVANNGNDAVNDFVNQGVGGAPNITQQPEDQGDNDDLPFDQGSR